MTQLNATTTESITTEHIIELVCLRFGIGRREIDGRKLSRRLARYRFIVFAMMQKHVRINVTSIGKHFSLDHTSVMYGLTHFVNHMRTSEVWRDDIRYIESTLNQGVEHVIGEIVSMRKPIVEKLKRPVKVVEPVAPKTWAKLNQASNYKPTITRKECEPTVDPARVNHRMLWFDYMEWKLRNPIDWFLAKRGSEAA